ncbi:MAG TPA: hypothetical protein VFX57_04205 [Sulfuricurvum sp.]|nr:hypothetical protein [Sulfuricurvum sp.]
MKILLLNDNPVVRKLVALSAQKTKDELNVVWSVEEVEDNAYDLLIVDDALYTPEIMAELQDKIKFKTNLFMATRGNLIPAGFDKVINKPFLPTDLVDLFSTIEKNLASAAKSGGQDLLSEEDFMSHPLEDDINLDDLALGEETPLEQSAKTNVLDHEEVQELQDLLDDTDDFEIDEGLSLDDFAMDDEEELTITEDLEDFETFTSKSDEEDLLASLDDTMFQALENESPSAGIENELDDMIEEFDFDEEVLDESESFSPEIQSEMASAEDEGAADNEAMSDEGFEELAGVSFEDLEDEGLEALGDDLGVVAAERIDEALLLLDEELEEEDMPNLEMMDTPLSDDEFGELEQQIQDAVSELGISDLETSLDDSSLDSFGLGKVNGFEGLDALDELDEREIKIAMGEAVEEEAAVRAELSEFDDEALLMPSDEEDDLESEVTEQNAPMGIEEAQASPAEGMEALQALLKALSNEEVAKSLKGLNISININFGNEK